MGMLPRVPGNKDKELVKQTYPMHMGRERHVVGIIWEKSYVMPSLILITNKFLYVDGDSSVYGFVLLAKNEKHKHGAGIRSVYVIMGIKYGIG